MPTTSRRRVAFSLLAIVLASTICTAGAGRVSADRSESVASGRGDASRLSTGTLHSCVALREGSVRCWGNGSSGQLGSADTDTIGDNETPGSVDPVALGAGAGATVIAAGDAHTCAILDNGNVTCWGLGTNGQLGYANTDTVGDNETPASIGTVALGTGRTATAITAGDAHTCAILDNGNVTCWGLGTNGRLGYANTSTIGDNETPGGAGTVFLGFGRTAVAISAGAFHTCAILDDATVRCWGLGTSGRLGYANTTTIGDDETAGSGGAVNLGAGRTAIAVSAGASHTCAITDEDTVRCWGLADFGQLGYANTSTVGDDETAGSSGAVQLPPRNDDFGSAAIINGASATVSGTSASSDLEVGEPAVCVESSSSIWYSWTPGATGSVTIDTFGSRFDTVLSVHTGSSVGALTQLACNDDVFAAPNPQQSRVTLAVTAGITYRIRIAGLGPVGAQRFGQATLHLQLTPDADGDGVPDASDNCPAAANPSQADADADGTGDACEPEPPPPPVGPAPFTTATPARFADTRPAGPTVDGAFSGAGRVRGGTSYEIQIAGRGTVPTGATAAIVNLTTVGASGPGFATAYPCGATVPTASSVNFGAGGVDPNEVVAKLSPTGSLCVFAFADTDVLVDVVGWAASASPYVPLTPARLADTRPDGPTTDGRFSGAGLVRGGGSYEIQVTGRGGVLAGAAAAVVNLTVTGATGPGFATAYPCSGDPIAASSLNYGPGQTIPNELVTKLSPTGSLCVYVFTDTHVLVDVVGYIPAGTGYTPLTPARLADTRPAGPTTDGRFSGAGIVRGGTSYEIEIIGRTTVPATATAAVVNLTVTGATGPGFATAYPCTGEPTSSSSLNYRSGTTRPNELVARLSAAGTLCIYAATDTHVLVDVVGYL
jgi:alpha-tubulin suppressor-like RCC1 family protein